MIDAWGGWDLFQKLLSTLKSIAQKYDVSIANVATNYILAKAAVAGVIIGDRLGIVDHRNDNTQVFNFDLDKSDCYAIDAVCTNANNLFEIIGDWILRLAFRNTFVVTLLKICCVTTNIH